MDPTINSLGAPLRRTMQSLHPAHWTRIGNDQDAVDMEAAVSEDGS